MSSLKIEALNHYLYNRNNPTKQQIIEKNKVYKFLLVSLSNMHISSSVAALITLLPTTWLSTTSFLGTPTLNSLTRTFQQKQYQQSQYQSKTLFATANDEDEEDDTLSAELSKLIGKRASISKKSSSSASTSTSKPQSQTIPSDNEEDAIIDPSFEKMYEGKSGMDIFEMPDFKTKRPLKTPKETEDKARGGEGKGKEEQGGGEYVDFFADYDDENDLHIPNRMGISTIAWGDVDQGFKAGKKLKKKEIKAGFYLAGDLQVS